MKLCSLSELLDRKDGGKQRQNSHQQFKLKSNYFSFDYIVHPKAINSEVFVAFINKIDEKFGRGDFALFLDNLSVHKTKDAKHLFKKLNITEIFNVPYCPQFNGIESYFSQLKATYKKLLMKCVINDAPYDTNGLIKQSINSVSNENATRCVRYALA
jgi:transposase